MALSPVVTPCAYAGWARNLRIANADAELVVTLDVGPRIMRYGRPGGPNLLGAIEAELGQSGESAWKLRGGHRLWASPEDPERTYVPDNGPVAHREEDGRVVLQVGPDERFRLTKVMELALAPRGTELTILHRIRNEGRTPQSLAVWALTVMAPGGEALVPLPSPGRHPGGAARTAADFAPRSTMALWPYFKFVDRRLRLGQRFIRLRQDANLSSTKFGLAHREGWVAYLTGGSLFLKRFGFEEGAAYPDGGCNFETYTDPNILELETLSPLCSIGPGEELSHTEVWSFADGVSLAAGSDESDEAVAEALAPHLPAASSAGAAASLATSLASQRSQQAIDR